MFLYPDKQLKENLFNYYKYDINERRMRKEEDLMNEKLNDKVYMDQIKRNNMEIKHRQESERQRLINETMNDYNNFMNKKEEDRRNRFNKNSSGIYNENVNFNKSQSISIADQMNSMNINPYSKMNMNPDMSLINMNKVKKDNLNHILYPEYIGVKKLYEMEKNDKNEFKKFYKNILDSQMNYKSSSPDYNNNYMVNNMISNPCKIFLIFLCLIDSSKRYQIQPTELTYNTITDPRNNIHHNKYLNRFAQSINSKNYSRNIEGMNINSPINRKEYNQNSNYVSNDYNNFNQNIYPISPNNQAYNSSNFLPINQNQLNSSGEKLRRVASSMIN